MACWIDTTVLIAYEDGQLNVHALVRGREDEAFYLSVISAGELLPGVRRVQDSTIRTRRSAFVEALLSRFPLLEIDDVSSSQHRMEAGPRNPGRTYDIVCTVFV